MPVPKWQIEQFSWLKETYFTHPDRRIHIKANEILLHQWQRNERLFLVIEGEASCSHQMEPGEEYLHILTARQDEFIGVQSFFSGNYKSFYKVTAKTHCTLAFIDKDTPMFSDGKTLSLVEQFAPVMASELSARHIRAALAVKEMNETQKRLAHAEQIATLGKMAAGIAHELNNAIGVLKQGRNRTSEYVSEHLLQTESHLSQYFQLGEEQGQKATASDVRKTAKDYEKDLKVDRNLARRIAAIAPQKSDLKMLGEKFLNHKEQAIEAWELGRTLHDMRIAAEHASNIVRSVKQLGREVSEKHAGVQVNDTLSQALTLLKREIRLVDVHLSFGNLPEIFADETELIQVWINIIKNAQEALINSQVENAEISILTRSYRHHLTVVISDNGPGVPEELQKKIFEPDFTTKKTGLSFGLGLGLSIVQRIVVNHGGELLLNSQPGNTKFKIRLPI